MEEKSNQKPKKDKHPLLWKYNIILGLVVTVVIAVIGAYALFLAERLAHDYQEQNEATELFKVLSQQLDNRLYRSRRYSAALRQDNKKPAEDVAQRRQLYFDSVSTWSSHFNRNLALLQKYFGKTAAYNLCSEIQWRLECLHRKIKGAQDEKLTEGQYKKVEKKIESLRKKSIDFDFLLINAIQDRKVGRKIRRDKVAAHIDDPYCQKDTCCTLIMNSKQCD